MATLNPQSNVVFISDAFNQNPASDPFFANRNQTTATGVLPSSNILQSEVTREDNGDGTIDCRNFRGTSRFDVTGITGVVSARIKGVLSKDIVPNNTVSVLLAQAVVDSSDLDNFSTPLSLSTPYGTHLVDSTDSDDDPLEIELNQDAIDYINSNNTFDLALLFDELDYALTSEPGSFFEFTVGFKNGFVLEYEAPSFKVNGTDLIGAINDTDINNIADVN